jgi:hypothetical protein
MNIAFDIDNTLYKVIPIEISSSGLVTRFKQIPDIDVFNLLYWYLNNGDHVFIWSAGGLDYTQNFIDKFFNPQYKIHALTKMVNMCDGKFFIDICYDDKEVKLAKVNVLVRNRLYSEEY